ncbi:MAG TPA: hypothetical protein EYP35_01575 [Desulfobacterales bacterium]|nr:hypothetical protein [Desulfobacterales bacterium]
MFKIGERYTRDEIYDFVGGSKQSYLPTKNRIVTCICLSKEMNPDAPHIILAGQGKIIFRSAKWLVSHGNKLPVFIKESPNNWIYQGSFKVKKSVTDKNEIQKNYRLAGREDVQMVIEMKEV